MSLTSQKQQDAEQWARTADRGAISAFLVETTYRLAALEGNQHFNEDTEQATSESLQDVADTLATVLENEFATRVSM